MFYISITDFFVLLIFISMILYWLDGMRAKEIARQLSKSACAKVKLEFLDDTVAIKKIRLRRNNIGQLTFYREYQFEFTSNGAYRYKGCVSLLGKQLYKLEMAPYHEVPF